MSTAPRFAVIGSGIAGNGAAFRLSKRFGAHSVVQFESEDRPGGHSATVDIAYRGLSLAVDTGFIVYNTLNYPRLTALFAELDVPTLDSDMGFSVSAEGGSLEWAGQDRRPIRSLFAQTENLVSPRFLGMLRDVLRFNRRAPADLAAGRLIGLSLGEYIEAGGYGPAFGPHYLLPMGAAIWSMSASEMLGFPAESFVAFFNNHRLLHLGRPVWRTVAGGSREYVGKMLAASGHEIRLASPVRAIRREGGAVVVVGAHGEERFDGAVLATHSDTARGLLADASGEERNALGAIRYAENDVVLHADPRFMPRRRAAWAAWNVRREAGDTERPVMVTYWMNRLQSLPETHPVFVTLNPTFEPAEGTVFGRYRYAHPQYDRPALAAQREFPRLQGRGNLWFAGAWLGHGFHEDGLRSGELAAEGLAGAFGNGTA